jgi:hypothetical protein
MLRIMSVQKAYLFVNFGVLTIMFMYADNIILPWKWQKYHEITGARNQWSSMKGPGCIHHVIHSWIFPLWAHCDLK